MVGVPKNLVFFFLWANYTGTAEEKMFYSLKSKASQSSSYSHEFRAGGGEGEMYE